MKTVTLISIIAFAAAISTRVCSQTAGQTKVITVPAPAGETRVAQITVPGGWTQPLPSKILSEDKMIDIRVTHFAAPMSKAEIAAMLAPIVERTPEERIKRIDFGGFVGVSAIKLARTSDDQTEVYFRLADGKCELSIIATRKGEMPLSEFVLIERIVRSVKITDK